MFTWAELIASYLRERYRLRVFAPLALVLATIGMVAAGTRFDAPAIAIRAVVACYVLVLAFRVWDDLEDRERDRREHPDRVLVRSRVTAPWLTLLVTAFVSGAAMVGIGANAPQRLVVLAAGAIVLFAWYRARGAMTAHPLVGTSVIFVKYPLIAYVAAPPTHPAPLSLSIAALLALYVALCTYEIVDDTTLRGSIQ